MKIIANIATYPAREEAMPIALERIAPQVDVINLVLNEYQYIPKSLARFENVNPIIPFDDLKDVGKFYPKIDDKDDFYVLMDDDILYPDNYVEKLRLTYDKFADIKPIIGVHGIIYSDFFEGLPASRLVHSFDKALAHDSLVNQLGTGTMMLKGWQMPSFEFMETSQRFVDLRIAIHAFRHKFPMICMEREKDWMIDMQTSESLFGTFTKYWPANIVAEAQEIAGFAKIPYQHIQRVEKS